MGSIEVVSPSGRVYPVDEWIEIQRRLEQWAHDEARERERREAYATDRGHRDER